MHHEATENGRLKWVLDARSAEMSSKSKQASIHDIHMIFYKKNGKHILLSSDTGNIDIKDKDITLYGNVVIKDMAYILKTPSLFYSDKNKKAGTDKGVEVSGKDIKINSDEMDVDLNTNTLFFKGNVKVYIGRISNKENI